MQLAVPLIETFWFLDTGTLKVPELTRIEAADVDKHDKNKVFSVTFRQGTQTEDLERTNWTNRRKYMYDRRENNMIEVAELNPDDLARLEVSLSLTATDLAFPDNTKLMFTGDSPPRVKDNLQFQAWWGLFPTSWAREVYKCCLEVNVDWTPKR